MINKFEYSWNLWDKVKNKKSLFHFNWYKRLIETRASRVIKEGKSIFKHHIFPRSIGKNLGMNIKTIDDKRNIIVLTGWEHLLAHLFLHKAIGGRMTYAIHIMLSSKSTSDVSNYFYKLSRETWEDICKEYKRSVSERCSGENSNFYNKRGKNAPGYGSKHMVGKTWVHSAEIRSHYVDGKLGAKNPMYGKPGVMRGKTHSDESKEKMSEAHKKFLANGGKNNFEDYNFKASCRQQLRILSKLLELMGHPLFTNKEITTVKHIYKSLAYSFPGVTVDYTDSLRTIMDSFARAKIKRMNAFSTIAKRFNKNIEDYVQKERLLMN